MSFLDTKRFYDRAIHRRFGNPLGADEAEVSGLEEALGVSLPREYKRFLSWMGSDSKGIFRGTDLFVTDIVENTNYLPEFLEENELAVHVNAFATPCLKV